MNINKNVSGDCKKKCEYSFDYPLTNLVARNKGDHISFRPDVQHVPPVRYNQEKYDVRVMKMYRASVHTFGGSPTDAELMIEHVSSTSGARLMVCIPVTTTSVNETTLDKMVQRVSQFAPTKGGDAGEISLPGFSLSTLVPKKPYYSYKGALPSSGMGSYHYEVIVFDREHSATISTSGHETLKDLIRPHSYRVNEAIKNIYYNKLGPNTDANGKDEIYIDCQPTGASEEETYVASSKGSNSYEMSSETKRTIMAVLAAVAYFFIAIFIVYVLYKKARSMKEQSLRDVPPSQRG
tara:strand:- start:538 stop:1419 length:882 start_codon:yes stop_codon:yes gene_type:complete